MKNKLFFLICVIAFNFPSFNPSFGMTKDGSEDIDEQVQESDSNIVSTSPRIETTHVEPPLRSRRSTHSKTKMDDSWMKQSVSAPSLSSVPFSDQKEKRGSVKLKYLQNLEFSQSSASLSMGQKPSVGSLLESPHSRIMPKLERAQSRMLTLEDQIARENLSDDEKAKDIFHLTHLINNRLILAIADARMENYVETLKNLRERVLINYRQSIEFICETQNILSYFQDYKQVYGAAERDLQSNSVLIQFMKSLHYAEALKDEARFDLESGFLRRFNESEINDDIPNRSLFMRTINEILAQCRLNMDKYPYMHLYGEIASKNSYKKQFLDYFKVLIQERLKEKEKKIPIVENRRLSFTVSTRQNEKLEKRASQLNLLAVNPVFEEVKKKPHYFASIKDYLEDIIEAIDCEIVPLNECVTSSDSIESNEIADYILAYWDYSTRKFMPNMDAEKLIETLTKIVDIYENTLIQTDPISYDPFRMFNFHYKEINNSWAGFQVYTHFMDKEDAFNPFVFLPLDEDECKFLVTHHCGRAKQKIVKDYLKEEQAYKVDSV